MVRAGGMRSGIGCMSDSIMVSIRGRCQVYNIYSEIVVRMDCSCVMKGSSPRVTDWHGACIYVMWSGVLKDVLEKTGGIRAWSV